jgi:hypothetical protein
MLTAAPALRRGFPRAIPEASAKALPTCSASAAAAVAALHHQRRAAEQAGQAGRAVGQGRADRSCLRRPDDLLRGGRIPAPDLDLADLPGRGHAGPEVEQVLAEDELERVRRAEVALGGCVGGAGRLAEVQLALGDGDLEADRPREALQELPVGLAGLPDVVVDPAAVVDRADLEADLRRDRPGDVRVLHVREGRRLPSP